MALLAIPNQGISLVLSHLSMKMTKESQKKFSSRSFHPIGLKSFLESLETSKKLYTHAFGIILRRSFKIAFQSLSRRFKTSKMALLAIPNQGISLVPTHLPMKMTMKSPKKI